LQKGIPTSLGGHRHNTSHRQRHVSDEIISLQHRDLWAGRGAFHLLLQEDRNLRILLYCIKAYALVPACLFLIACQ